MCETLCWSCANSVNGKCEYAKSLKPIENWRAEKVLLRTHINIDLTIHRVYGYKVYYCPKYNQDTKTISLEEIRLMLGIKKPAFYNTQNQSKIRTYFIKTFVPEIQKQFPNVRIYVSPVTFKPVNDFDNKNYKNYNKIMEELHNAGMCAIDYHTPIQRKI